MTQQPTGGFRFRQLFPETPLIAIADIGAGDDANRPVGLEGLTQLCTTGDAVLYGFDGDERSFDAVAGFQSEHRHYLPYFIGDGGEHTFYETNSPFTGSLFPPNRSLIDQFPGLGELMLVQRSFPVQTHRLDDIDELPPVDAMKLDVQGAELAVLQNATRQLETTLLIQCEVEFVPLYENQPLYGDIDAFLRQHGFLLLTLFHIHRRMMKPAYSKQMAGAQSLWTDALFIRDFRTLRKLEESAVLKLAAVMHDVYGHIDVTSYCLQELDARAGTDRLRLYAEKISARFVGS